jgi:centromeric protein E
MSTTLPRPSRPSNGPPNMALPALPVAKTRKSTGAVSPPNKALPSLPKPSQGASTAPSTPRIGSGLRAPSTSFGPPSPAPNSALPQPQPKGLPVPNTPGGKTLKKSVSINSFPHPPRGDQRASSLPPSPLANDQPRSVRKSKLLKDNNHLSIASSTPSLLNGSGEGKAINNTRMSDGLISISSPPQSRSSSAQDSYSTSATTYDDPMDSAAQKSEHPASASGSASSEKRSSKSEGKGNVLVSVRVRPDSSASQQKPDGEWMVDGRKALISYKGKEGGDHYYGRLHTKFVTDCSHH